MQKTKTEDTLILKYIPLKTIKKWTNNRKKHDIPTLIKSLETHGFKDPLKYEPALNNGSGGIVEGNGRDEALQVMYDRNKKKPPRGIFNQDNDWMVPVLFGVDSKSQAAAEAYGYDHNNITMMGGELDLGDIMRTYEEGTAELLRQLDGSGNLPVSISANDLDALLDSDREQLNEREETIQAKNMLRILISVPAGAALDVQDYIDAIRKVPDVEVNISGNNQ